MLLSWLALLLLALFVSSSGSPDRKLTSYSFEDSQPVMLSRRHDASIDANYGIGLAACGSRVFVGSYSDRFELMQVGAVYVYTPTSEGQWHLEDKLHPSLPAANINFGWSLDCNDGNLLVVGAYADSSLGLDKAGVVYIYARDEGDVTSSPRGLWDEVELIYSDNPQAEEFFGWAVGLYENTLAVSAIGNNELATECGVVYIFNRNKESRAYERRLQSEYGEGYYYHDQPDGEDKIKTWEIEYVISPVNSFAYLNFGWSLSIFGDVVVIGAPWENHRRGAVYVYVREETEYNAYDDLFYMENDYSFVLLETITAPDTSVDDGSKSYFGYSVSIDADLLVVGHYLGYASNIPDSNVVSMSNQLQYRTGRAYAYLINTDGASSSSTVNQVADLSKLAALYLSEFHLFGHHVSVSGRTVIVGAPGDGHTNLNGTVFVFTARDSHRSSWELSHCWRGDKVAPFPPPGAIDGDVAASKFGIVTKVSQEGGLIVVSDSQGFSFNNIQTGSIFLWEGKEDIKISVHKNNSSTIVISMLVLTLVCAIAARWRIKRRRELDDLLEDNLDDFASDRSSSEVDEPLASKIYNYFQRKLFSTQQKEWKETVLMTRLATESSHGDNMLADGFNANPNIDVQRLLATAQAVADDDGHPNHDDVEELINTYKRDWITIERFQKEFQRLVF